MAMGIVDDSAFESELENLTVKTPESADDSVAKIVDITRGRGEGNREVPDSLKKVIAEEKVLSGRAGALGLARAFGVSDSSVSAYSNGATSTKTYNNPESGLKNHVENAKKRVARSARQKLSLALSKITPEKLEETKARDLAGIAKDMSAVIRNMEERQEDTLAQTNFIFYSPKTRPEDQYEVIDVKE